MKWRLQLVLRRLGTAGVLGIGLLAACTGFWASALAPAERELGAQRLAAERLRARTPYQPVATSGRAEELRRFYNLFPSSASLTAELERVHALARRAGLELDLGHAAVSRRRRSPKEKGERRFRHSPSISLGWKPDQAAPMVPWSTLKPGPIVEERLTFLM